MAAFRPKTKTNTSDAPLVFTALSAQATGDLVAAKKEWSAKLLRRSQAKIQGARALTAAVGPDPDLNLMGVGIGEKLVDDKPTGILTLKFLVRIKYPPNQVLTKYLLVSPMIAKPEGGPGAKVSAGSTARPTSVT